MEKVIHLGVRKQILAQPSVKGHNGPIGGKREHGTEDHRLPVAVIKIVQVLHLVLLQQGLRRFAEQALTQKGAVPYRHAHIPQPHRGHAGTPAQGHGEPIRIKLLPRSREPGHAGENTINGHPVNDSHTVHSKHSFTHFSLLYRTAGRIASAAHPAAQNPMQWHQKAQNGRLAPSKHTKRHTPISVCLCNFDMAYSALASALLSLVDFTSATDCLEKS